MKPRWPAWSGISSLVFKPSAILALGFAMMLGLAGCASPHYQNPKQAGVKPPRSELTLREGDVLNVTFPGAPNLNTTQQIRRDGKITLQLVGDVTASGFTPAELQAQLLKLYSNQLVDKEVVVTVQASSFPVFVTGAVIKPGQVQTDHPLTALEAIMLAGGFDYTRANLKAVTVIRNVNGRLQHYKLNLKAEMDGSQNEPFYLRPSDIVYVPEKFTWF